MQTQVSRIKVHLLVAEKCNSAGSAQQNTEAFTLGLFEMKTFRMRCILPVMILIKHNEWSERLADTASLLIIGAKAVLFKPTTAVVVQSLVCKTHHCCTEEEKRAENRSAVSITGLKPNAETPLRHRRDEGGC